MASASDRSRRELGSTIFADHGATPAQYRNPVYAGSFPDPFVLKFGGRYYAYSTGHDRAGERAFSVLRSSDLVDWEYVGGAMEILDSAPPLYWAPEVTYADGRFYLYYSCGNEKMMEIRVATSELPDRQFVDSGVRLTSEEFAIDPHVFTDDDGQKYLFYATDFLSHTHIGTGTVVDRLVDWFQLGGDPRPVTRAKYDWQVYDPCRAEKGNVRWHTVEGPTVLKRKGIYYEMFSGGNWKNNSYGVGYAVSESLLNPEEWRQPINGASTLPILRSVEGEVLGPGHNSVVLGRNSRELFCVYHSWIGDERVMSIDRVDIVGDRIILLGPTVTTQPQPFLPRPALRSGTALPEGEELLFEDVSSSFLIEATFRLASQDSQIKFAFADGGAGKIGELTLRERGTLLRLGESAAAVKPPFVPFNEFQCLWIERNAGRFRLFLNGRLWHEDPVAPSESKLQIRIESCLGAEMLNLDLTEGFVDLFDDGLPVGKTGWKGISGAATLTLSGAELVIEGLPEREKPCVVVKGDSYTNFEFAVNIRNLGAEGLSAYGFVLLSAGNGFELSIELKAAGGSQPVGDDKLAKVFIDARGLFSTSEYRQFRFIKQDGILTVDSEGLRLGEFSVGSQPSRMGIAVRGKVAVEMARSIRL